MKKSLSLSLNNTNCVYFSKKLGFLYMTPRADRSSNEYSPYNLKIVTHENIKPDDYMTISSQGVTRIYDGDTEFTDLDRWELEYK